MEGLLVGADLHLRIHTISLRSIRNRCKSWQIPVVGRLYQTLLCSFRAGPAVGTTGLQNVVTDAPVRRSSSESSRASHWAAPRTSNRRACSKF